MEILPAVTSSSPAMRRRSVDLPQPEGPSSTTNRPCSARKLTPSTAATPPKRFVTPSRTISDNAPPLREGTISFNEGCNEREARPDRGDGRGRRRLLLRRHARARWARRVADRPRAARRGDSKYRRAAGGGEGVRGHRGT